MKTDEAGFYGMGLTESFFSCFRCLKTPSCKCAIPYTKTNAQHTKDPLGSLLNDSKSIMYVQSLHIDEFVNTAL